MTKQPTDILTYQILGEGIFAITRAEYEAGARMPENWDDFVWQSGQPSKEAAIARHDDALDLYTADCNAGLEIEDAY